MSTFTAVPMGAPAPAKSTAAATRASAIEVFNKGLQQAAQPQETPVLNPSQVSPEEMSAIRPPSGQPNTVEASEPEAVPEAAKEESPPISSQYAVLARKEKALRAKMQQAEASAKASEAAMAAREAAVKAKEAEYQANYVPKDRLTNDTWNTLQELGISYDQLTQLALNPPPQESPAQKMAFQKLQAEIQSLKDAQDNSQKTYKEQQQASYQQAVNQIRSEAKQLVSSDPNTYEAIAAHGAVNDVVDLIEKTFKADGILLTVEEAAQAVEEHLMEEAMKITRIKKIQQRLQPAAPAKQTAQDTPKQTQPLKTLTNAVGSSRPLTAKERAIAAFKGQLK